MNTDTAITMLLAMGVAAVVSFLSTPMVKSLAYKVGAIDVPKDNRRMHKVPIPRLGGLTIFLAFLLSTLVFADIDRQMQGILLGAVMIVVLGVMDDIMALKALPKLIVQIAAAGVAVYYGCRIQFLSNPNVFSDMTYVNLGWLSVPITIIWIVAITNAVNFIDGLDGLAVGVSAISTASLIVIALMVAEVNIAIILCALFGACLGFIPYNFNPAKIFMGDGGSLFLGFMLSTMSILGPVKSATIVAVIIPVLVLGVPIFDTAFAIFRRLVNKRPIMEADKGHLHHRLMKLGYGQRRATLMLYGVSGIMGISSVTFSRGLWVETLGLFAIALMLIYIFLTDANHIMPQIKNPEAYPAVKQGEMPKGKEDCHGDQSCTDQHDRAGTGGRAADQ